jgi:predicted membrane protein
VNVATDRPITGRLIAGGILILLGVLFTLDNFGVIDAGDVVAYWPLILIGLGVSRIVRSRHPDQRIGGIILVILGSLFLVRTLHLGWFRFRDLWPALLLGIGALLVWQSLSRRRFSQTGTEPGNAGARALEGAREGLAASRERRGDPVEAGSVLNEFAFMGGGDRVVRAQDFRGGEVTAIMGGFHIDLRGAGIAGDSATLEVFTFWGGVDLKVPEDWSVVVRGTPILGVFTNSARSFPAGQVPSKTLILTGAAVMGGVEVKN